MARAGAEDSVAGLIPKLAASKVEDRYAAQMELQALAAKASQPGAEAQRIELSKALALKASDAAVPQPARVWIVRQLEYIGAAESVPALAGLLNGQDAELRECARRALEKNSAPSATESLRAALKKGGDVSWRIGLIQSLGERRDTASVRLIGKQLANAEASFAAAMALGKIANDSAVKELWTALDQKNSTAANALVFAADRLLAKGDNRRTGAIYSKLYMVCASAPLRAAALTGLARAEPEPAKNRVIDALSSDDPRLKSAALTAAREAYGKGLSDNLAALLPKLEASAKILVLPELDSSAERQVIALAGDPDAGVRVAVVETLGRIGGASSVPFLLSAASEKTSDRQKAATAALAKLADPAVGEAIVRAAAQGEPRLRVAAITAVAARHDTASVPVLMGYASDPDRAVSSAACKALGQLATDADIENLARLALAGKSPGAESALQTVVGRAGDKSAAAQKLVALTQGAAPGQLALLFDTLTILGGNEALKAIATSASSSNDEVKDAAIRSLANWPDYAATKPLLAIASDPDTRSVHNVLAIQGVVRLVKASDQESANTRLIATLDALKASRRDEEKQLVLSTLASVPSAKSAEAIKTFLNDPKFRIVAGMAGVTLAGELIKTDKAAATDLAQAVKEANVSETATRKAEALLKE